MWAIKFFSILILIILQGQAVYTHPRKSSTSQRSKDSTSSDNKPFSCPGADRAICVFLGTTGTSVQLARKNGLQYSCDNVPRKCCSDALKFDEEKAKYPGVTPVLQGEVTNLNICKEGI
ncbi:hypothetical protein PGT21_004028 [Puccinia graminis f. sp. tritici]|uniref:Hydrophobin n=1 Tax=Puccinia graminis f. sp. tritici TaxID=56615 RepID=A0A5B0QEK3_PUCGR|nr:hypothetical protein PGT21_004028 [Puccinia graminis f. sp. tritici]KAA1123799.1 hypothetical protein PGTUg99_020489 [Puccinia graminis f. sp. tritici]